MALILHRKKDGSVRLDGPPPEHHELSTRMLGRLVQEGYGTVRLVLHTAQGDVVYELERAILADEGVETSPVASYAFGLIEAGEDA